MNNNFNNEQEKGNDISQVMLAINKMNQDTQLETSKLITEHFNKEIKELRNDYRKLLTKFNFLTEEQKETRIDVKNLEQSQSNADTKVSKLEYKIDNFKNDDTGQFELYKSTAKARVHKIVGEKGSIKYILFYSSFSLKIYSDIYNHFGANNSGNIKMENANIATNMAKSWKPNMSYVTKKLKEYSRMEENGSLKEPRLTAYNKYLEMTNGGNNIEF